MRFFPCRWRWCKYVRMKQVGFRWESLFPWTLSVDWTSGPNIPRNDIPHPLASPLVVKYIVKYLPHSTEHISSGNTWRVRICSTSCCSVGFICLYELSPLAIIAPVEFIAIKCYEPHPTAVIGLSMWIFSSVFLALHMGRAGCPFVLSPQPQSSFGSDISIWVMAVSKYSK